MILADAIGFNVSVDGDTPTQLQFNGTCDPDNPVINFTVFDVQSLAVGNHTLDLNLINATGECNCKNYSDFLFDYASVNETTPTPATSTNTTSAER